MSRQLAARVRERLTSAVPGPGWRRAALLRRGVAGLLATLALALALAPPSGPQPVPVLVAATDLTPGGALSTDDLAVRYWPRELVPSGALPDPSAAAGRVLAGAVRAGEPITDVRLAGATIRAGPPGTAAVPVRLADPGVAGLLTPGSRVDVVGLDESTGAAAVLAPDAAVLAVLPAAPGPGSSGERMILVTMPRELATRVAAASVGGNLTITLR